MTESDVVLFEAYGWEVFFNTRPRPKTETWHLTEYLEKKVARNKFWLYIKNALRDMDSVHCQVQIADRGTQVFTWLYVDRADRPWFLGEVESPVQLYDAHLEPGYPIRFKPEHIRQVLLTPP